MNITFKTINLKCQLEIKKKVLNNFLFTIYDLMCRNVTENEKSELRNSLFYNHVFVFGCDLNLFCIIITKFYLKNPYNLTNRRIISSFFFILKKKKQIA
jgi:hypothetical protein